MIPAFRYSLLSVDDGVAENVVDYHDHKIDDNMLHQMQRLISNLEIAKAPDFNPLGFCFAFKEMDGSPTNIAEQKDA